MRRIIVQYGMPEDPAAFDAHYKNIHTPLTAKMPNLKSFEISSGPVISSDESKEVYLIATLSFDNAAEMETSMASAEGQAAVADVANFASGGVTIYTVDTDELL